MNVSLNTSKRIVLAVAIAAILAFVGYWAAWSHGFVLARVRITDREWYVIREIPPSPDMLSMVLGSNDSYFYRMEVCHFSPSMTDCKTFIEDSYRADSARIDHTPERTTFFLDGTPRVTFSARGEWKWE
jgi:hypothetical protein